MTFMEKKERTKMQKQVLPEKVVSHTGNKKSDNPSKINMISEFIKILNLTECISPVENMIAPTLRKLFELESAWIQLSPLQQLHHVATSLVLLP